MSPLSFPYPATPANVPSSITEPSAAFKKQVGRVMGSIILFFIVYLLMLALSLLLVALSVYGGFAIIANLGGLLPILGGIGLIGLGVMVFFFLIKFMFAVSKFDQSGSIEISEQDQPELFAFIRQIAADTQAPFPKKIFLSAEVNAAVFYNSGFWSMFFPVRKNLLIGLGLVNTVNLSEFKAVIAHEFGHFSQRSMKLGSFVYNVNRIIYNMLYDNKGYGNVLSSWAEIHGVFALFASITVGIASGIQKVLKLMYGVINKSYLALSREMEFHADAVAASVSGSGSLVTALRRVELGQLSYSTALTNCNDLFREKKYSNDIFHNQSVALKQFTSVFKLTEKNGLPVVSDDFLSQNNSSRINIKDQWASHPSLEDRERHLNSLAVAADANDESAWVVFRDRDHLKQELTKTVYRNVVLNDEMKPLEAAEFETWFDQSVNKFRLPEAYNGFYDARGFYLPDEQEETGLLRPAPVTRTFEEIFSAKNAGLNKQIESATADLELLKAIEQQEYPVKTFDFDGKKHNKSEAAEIALRVEEEVSVWTEALKQADKDSVQYFITRSTETDKLAGSYRDFFALRRRSELYLDIINKMIGTMAPLFQGRITTAEQAQAMVNILKQEHEPAFKRNLTKWTELGLFDHDPDIKERAAKFIVSDYAYFAGTSFFENEVAAIDALARDSWTVISTMLSSKFKQLVEFQLESIEK